MQALVILRKFSFCSRFVNIWNSFHALWLMPIRLILLRDVDKHWIDQDIVYNFNCEFTRTAGCINLYVMLIKLTKISPLVCSH